MTLYDVSNPVLVEPKRYMLSSNPFRFCHCQIRDVVNRYSANSSSRRSSLTISISHRKCINFNINLKTYLSYIDANQIYFFWKLGLCEYVWIIPNFKSSDFWLTKSLNDSVKFTFKENVKFTKWWNCRPWIFYYVFF